jgi:hypothetical protein
MLDKLFTDDPVPPGGTATLQFTINNFDRSNAMTAIGFTDDLAPVLAGLTATGLPLSDPCGTGSGLAGSAGDTLLTFTGGSLPAGGSCTFSVSVAVPGGAADGQYTNTTSSVTGTVGGDGVVGNAATDILRVVSAPVITKEFTDDPVGAGGAATLVFTITITNTSTTSAATNVSFSDQFDVIMPTAATPTSDCGGTVTFTPLSNPAPPSSVVPATLSLTSGTLAASSSRTISIVLDVLTSAAEGIYANTTSVITATVGANPVAGPPAGDSLTVRGGPTLRKEFSDDPVLPGGTATLQFDLTHTAEAPGDATSITFTDDLTFVSGVTASGLPLTNICGVGSSLTGSVGDTLLTFAGGTLAPGGTCGFSLTVDVSASAPWAAIPTPHLLSRRWSSESERPAARVKMTSTSPCSASGKISSMIRCGRVSRRRFGSRSGWTQAHRERPPPSSSTTC